MKPPKKWRSEAQIRGYQAALQRALDVAVMAKTSEVTLLDRKTARGILEILVQARWTERNYEPSAEIEREIDVALKEIGL